MEEQNSIKTYKLYVHTKAAALVAILGIIIVPILLIKTLPFGVEYAIAVFLILMLMFLQLSKKFLQKVIITLESSQFTIQRFSILQDLAMKKHIFSFSEIKEFKSYSILGDLRLKIVTNDNRSFKVWKHHLLARNDDFEIFINDFKKEMNKNYP